ncbi:nuclear transport factor 2 family protein [Tolypothrix sp. FACHB-123]|nr:nuclear transport factor 2 family protein [Tolypothrix sp. FACHB-123]
MDRLGILKQALTAVETNDVDTYITLFTEDAVYKIGNYEPVIGREGIKAFALPVMQMFKSVVHEAKNIWELGNTIVSEMNVIYTRQDDKVFAIPCLNIITFKGDKIQKYQAFIDASPAFS